MNIMIDANIIISAILFPKSIISETLKHIVLYSKITLCQYTIDEIRDVFNRKFPNKLNEMEKFLMKLPYELFSLNKINIKKYPNIRDINDIPVIANAIESKVEILITGDKDFDGLKIKKLRIMKPNEYKELYIK